MPETLPEHIPSPRTPLVWDGTRYRAVRGHTDGTVQVRGEDQLWTYKDRLALRALTVSGGAADEIIATGTPLADQIWIIYCIAIFNQTNNSGACLLQVRFNATDIWMDTWPALTQNQAVTWTGKAVLKNGDILRAVLSGTANNDVLWMHILGSIMTLET